MNNLPHIKNLELENAMVVHGLDGLDELSVIGKTKIGFLKNGPKLGDPQGRFEMSSPRTQVRG